MRAQHVKRCVGGAGGAAARGAACLRSTRCADRAPTARARDLRGQIEREVANGRMRRVHRGVFLLGPVLPTPRPRARSRARLLARCGHEPPIRRVSLATPPLPSPTRLRRRDRLRAKSRPAPGHPGPPHRLAAPQRGDHQTRDPRHHAHPHLLDLAGAVPSRTRTGHRRGIRAPAGRAERGCWR